MGNVINIKNYKKQKLMEKLYKNCFKNCILTGEEVRENLEMLRKEELNVYEKYI